MERQDDDEDLKDRLHGAAHYYVAKLCEHELENSGKTIGRQGVAMLNEAFCQFIESFAFDVELFAKHRKKKTVTSEEKNPGIRTALEERLKEIQSTLEAEKEGKAAAKKRRHSERDEKHDKKSDIDGKEDDDMEIVVGQKSGLGDDEDSDDAIFGEQYDFISKKQKTKD